MQRVHRLSLEAAGNFFDAWADRFVKNGPFHSIGKRPVLSILSIRDFAITYGFQGFRILLQFGRSRIRSRIGVEPYIMGIFNKGDTTNVTLANQLLLDGVTGYALLPDWTGPPIQSYKELIEERVQEWYRMQARLQMPFFPVVSAGWDATVRGQRVQSLQRMKGFPWRPVVTGVTPHLFGHFLDEAIHFNNIHHPELPYVFLHAWNEWTESSAIEASDKYGTKLLDEVRKRSPLANR